MALDGDKAGIGGLSSCPPLVCAQQDEAARLEAELEARHAAELACLEESDADQAGSGPSPSDLLSADLYSVRLNDHAPKQVTQKSEPRASCH